MRQIIENLVSGIVQQLQSDGTLQAGDLPEYKVERPRDETHGDFATNAALVLSRFAKMKPRDLAQKMLAALPANQKEVDRWEVAGPGFINFHITSDRIRQLIPDILQMGQSYGSSKMGSGKRVLIEFVSANPTGPMHVGHGRGAVMGDAIASILKVTGHTVEREYYINDAGNQVGVLGWSVMMRYHELFGCSITMPEGCYPAQYVVEIAKALRDQDGNRWLNVELDMSVSPPIEVVDFAMDTIMGWIRGELATINILFDNWFSERTLHADGKIEATIGELTKKDLIFEGVLAPPKGKLPDDWEARPQLLFKSTKYGDAEDRALKKSDGSATYFAADIAYHFDKAQRGYDLLIDVWGADHGGYVKRVQAALTALTDKNNLLEVELVQMVNLVRGGEPVKMSKRDGTFVTLKEVVDEVGSDAVRFIFLTRSGGASLDFDLELAVSKSNDNPVYYVQYAHARIHAVYRQLQEKGLDKSLGDGGGDLSCLTLDAEMSLIRALGTYPEMLEGAAINREPHRVPYFLIDLASAFHTYYNSHRILEDDKVLLAARLSLINAVRQVLANGLTLLGVSAPERM
ncbi:MAG: arginine--tRNA ligase [Magnetococcales bacterium]|nr:arginine--tRNA ligase [Magnetococcales bacterium]